MTNPCLNCKRKPNCPAVCYPKKDYDKALKKAEVRRKRENRNRNNSRVYG